MKIKYGFLALLLIIILVFPACFLFGDPSDDDEGDKNGSQAEIVVNEKVVGLVLVVEFQDEKAIHSWNDINHIFNRRGGIAGSNSSGSVYDYFIDVSKKHIGFTNIISPIITLPYNKSYYDNRDYTYNVSASLVITDALNILNDMNFNISGITVDENNRAIALSIFYAGSSSHGRDGGLYYHASTYNGGGTLKGIGFRRYQVTNLGTNTDLTSRFGVLIHEIGHMLTNWRDLYGPEALSRANPVGDWCIMADNRGRFPSPPNIYFRHLAKWTNTIDITNAEPGTVFEIEANSNTAYVYWRNEKEAYFIEARLRRDSNSLSSWDLPGSGLAIWHIHTDGVNTLQDSIPLVALMQADGRKDLEKRVNRGDVTDLFRTGVNTRFNATTAPAAIWHDGTPSDFAITRISDVGAVMTFKIGSEDYEEEMRPKYKFYHKIDDYMLATENVEAIVSENFTLDKLVSISAPATAGITLTIRSENPAAPVTLTRGESGNLFTVPSGVTLILENVIIDGGRTGSFSGGGGGSIVRINSGGTFIMNDSEINNNMNSGNGGGVYVNNGGTFTMNGGKIRNNDAGFPGGGVFLNTISAFTMNGGEISGNSIPDNTAGSGVAIFTGSTFTMNNGVISGNTGGNGAGVRVSGTFIMNGGEIKNNHAVLPGGGVAVQTGGMFTLINGKISGNTTANNVDAGGVSVSNGTFIMVGGEISGNIAGNNGGGVRVSGDNGIFNMYGGKISRNIGGNGSGVRVSGGIFNMEGGEISGNSSSTSGSGVRISDGEFNLNGGVIAGTGANINNVVNGTYNFNTVAPNNAVIIAWNRPLETPSYEAGTSINLTASPENAIAVWSMQDTIFGISYTNDENTGFIDINAMIP